VEGGGWVGVAYRIVYILGGGGRCVDVSVGFSWFSGQCFVVALGCSVECFVGCWLGGEGGWGVVSWVMC